jgi:hypothetical protein
MEIRTVSLAGGVATIDRHLPPGTPVQLKMQRGLRNLQATALLRDYRGQGMSFEIVDMSLEERGKLRRLLAENLSPAGALPASPLPDTTLEETSKPIVTSDAVAASR